ncbi:hypothetical protein ACFSKU_08800 [Pontibacter silvestris]|uniref:DUF3800 domain-containing protein n=1 Tax=Pontibacter silvestris TaxID=2305183 RepID=A0ABW4WY97_9BACT|nr:hypothetical protein [Pontibacter silvestris]MCC9138790.1 hypothetical protein [Pontibacter silvestris]
MAKVGFVSESGAHGFIFEDPEDTHFSVTVVLVEEEHKREVEAGFHRIRQRYFPDGQLLLSGDGADQARQREMARELRGLGFSFPLYW